MATTERRFLADQSGVVALTGLAMAVFMTAVLYYEIGVGDAITFHEQLQDASDATGFASAVYHAKGMNMIALVNIIMSAVLAVIVVLRVVGRSAASSAGSPRPSAGSRDSPVPSPAGWRTRLELVRRDRHRVGPRCSRSAPGAQHVSTAIAAGMPWVAAVKSATVGPIYYPQVTSNVGGETIAVSVSLVPDLSWIPISSSKSTRTRKKARRSRTSAGDCPSWRASTTSFASTR